MEEQLRARRLLSHGTAATAAPSPAPVSPLAERGSSAAPFSSLDATVFTILSLLLCGLVVVLVLHGVIRCAFRVTRRVCYGQDPPGAAADQERAVQAGYTRKGALRTLPSLVYSAGLELAWCRSTECAICLAEFAHGERVRVLPSCNHVFHVRCIDRWLAARPTCPTCRQTPFAKPAMPGPEDTQAAVQQQARDDVRQHMELEL